MKYTKYNIRGIEKRKKSSQNSIIIILTFIVCIGLSAILLSKYFFKTDIGKKLPNISNGINKINNSDNNNEKNIYKNDKDHKNVKESSKGYMEFYGVQCGVFKSEENAKKVLESIKNIVYPTVIHDGEFYKIIGGVFLENNVDTVIQKLNSLGIEYNKAKFEVNMQDEGTAQIGKIIDGTLKILNKFNDPNIKSINTGQLKKWTSQLSSNRKIENDPNYLKLNELKKYIQKLPKEINRKSLSENYNYIYVFLKNLN
ncbi:hypothetical protein C3495_08490 [Clostridiaceae bacterium 14S0207]|nr:hypothetical protein C3495_08490 [Clostridiaceae bacterium 14S0207]